MPTLHLSPASEAAYVRAFRVLLRGCSERLSSHLEGLPPRPRALRHLLAELFSGCLAGFLPPRDVGRLALHYLHHPAQGPLLLLRIALALLLSVIGTIVHVHDHGWAQTQSDVLRMGLYWMAFAGIDICCGWLAYRLEPRAPRFPALLLVAQHKVGDGQQHEARVGAAEEVHARRGQLEAVGVGVVVGVWGGWCIGLGTACP